MQKHQIQFIAANYSRLQGLKAVPYGLGLLLITLWANLRRDPRADLVLPLVILLAMVGLISLADRYYKDHYGRIQPAPRTKRFLFFQSLLGGIIGLGAFILDISSLRLPVSFVGLVFAGAFLWEYFSLRHMAAGRYLLIYPAVVAITLIASLLPALGLGGWWQVLGLRSQLFGVMLIVGVEMMIAGLAGHIYLTRLLPLGGAHGRSL